MICLEFASGLGGLRDQHCGAQNREESYCFDITTN
jgi:hypothetical protein